MKIKSLIFLWGFFEYLKMCKYSVFFCLEKMSDKKSKRILVSIQGVHLSNRLEYVGVAVLAIAPSILVFDNPVPLMFL
jgi:hypothetical protein